MKFFYRSKLWTVIWFYILLIYLTLPLMRSVLNFLKETIGRDALGQTLNGLLLLWGIALLVMAIRLGWRIMLHVAIPLAIILAASAQLEIPEERFHFLQYGLLGVLVLKTCRVQDWAAIATAAVFVVLVGTGDELIQWALPNRVGDLRDVAMNTVAGVLGVWIGKSLFWDSSPSST